MSKTKYQCTGTTISWLKPPEGVTVACEATSSIVQPGTKCKVTCDSGSPNYDMLQCKNVGWRPTRDVKCEGVDAGVIAGVLIAGIAGVVILAIIYAKYKQHQKEKLGITTTRQTGKICQNGRRPGRTDQNQDRPGSRTNHPAPPYSSQQQEMGRSSRGSSRTAPPSYHENDDYQGDMMSSKSSSLGRAPPPVPQHDRRRHGQASKLQAPAQQSYNADYPGYYDNATAPPSLPQVGYNTGAYYQQGPQIGYGYSVNEPSVGYSAYAHPQSYPTSRGDYNKPYQVPT